MEQLDESFQSYFTGKKTPPPAEFVKKSMVQLSKILLILYEKLRFNHRDLKPDNVMITEVQGSKMVRLIDFGFACLHYKNLNVSFASPNSGAALLKTCDSRSRDLHSFFFYLTTYIMDDKTPLVRIIKALLAADYKEAAKWKNTYTLYNEKNTNQSSVKPKNLTFETVHAVFKSLSLTNPSSPISEITSSWAKHLSTVYINTAKYLTFDEYNVIPESKKTTFILEFFKTNKKTIWHTSNNPNTLIGSLEYYIEKQIGPFQVPDTLIPELFLVFISYDVTLEDMLGETILHKIARNPTASKELELVLAKNNSEEFTEKKNLAGQTALDIALLSNFGTAIDKLAQNSNFMQDFAYGGEKIIKLVEKRPQLALELRYFTKTLLHLIAGRGQSPQVKNLLDLLLAQNPGQEFVNLSSNTDMRALDIAICTKNIYCINKLFELNAQITPTHLFFCLAEISDPKLIDKLIDRYADTSYINYQQDYTRKTALMNASELNNRYLVDKLIMLGADITLKDNKGLTALNKTRNKKSYRSGGTRKIKASA
jgi:ankyrin repeat protein